MENQAHIVCSEPVVTHERGLVGVAVIVGATSDRYLHDGKWYPESDNELDPFRAATKAKITEMLGGWVIDQKSPFEIKGGALNLEDSKEWYVRVVDYPANYPAGYMVYCYKVAGPDTVPPDIRTKATPAKVTEYKRQLAEELPAILHAGDLAEKISSDLSTESLPLSEAVQQQVLTRLKASLNYEAREIYSKGRTGGLGA